MKTIEIIRCNFENPEHCQAEIDLMRHYMTDPMGGVEPLTETQNQQLIAGLRNHPTTLTLLAHDGDNFVGLTNGFVNFSTFAVKPFLNIHDVVVRSEVRGMGIGRLLLNENIRIARNELNCAKITLEVRHDNPTAQSLYRSLGFADTMPPMYFWSKKL